jgi:hypothetical protein
MTQRIFDIENEKDMQDLWDILPDDINKIVKDKYQASLCDKNGKWIFTIPYRLIKINWHDKTEITRPIQEATKVDVGKICVFWDDEDEKYFGKLRCIGDKYFTMLAPVYEDLQFVHCRRLTKQEIEEFI